MLIDKKTLEEMNAEFNALNPKEQDKKVEWVKNRLTNNEIKVLNCFKGGD